MEVTDFNVIGYLLLMLAFGSGIVHFKANTRERVKILMKSSDK
jgi:hypothetical protein